MVKHEAIQKVVPAQGCRDCTTEVIVVGGGVRGPALLNKAIELCNQSEGKARVRGVVLDNPDLKVSGWRVRYTWYPQFDEYKDLMQETAVVNGLPCYWDYVSKQYRPDINGFSAFEQWLFRIALERDLGDKKDLRLLFLMSCFGQRWGKSTIALANGWFINFHPVGHGSVWNKENPFCGPVPYEMMCREGSTHCDLVAHLIDNTFDGGVELCRVGPYPLTECSGRRMHIRRLDGQIVKSKEQGDFVLSMHQRMCEPTMCLLGKFFNPLVDEILDNRRPCASTLSRIKGKILEAA